MIVSTNSSPSKNEFDDLLNSTLQELNIHAKKSPAKIKNLKGSKLEPFVFEIMDRLAIGSNFENSIELIGGQNFPDIIAKKYYGIEVKTTTKNHWKTTGNSVLESTRVEGVERIFMLFGKLGNPIEFKCRPYEECLSEVVVTHSPRYLIDMNLGRGKTIFDKINIPYDQLRKDINPIKYITQYYKSKLKPGQNIWWLDQGNSNSSNFIIDIWSNLSRNEKQKYKNKAMAYFPEIFSNKGNKFTRFAIWLTTRETIVCPNIRDLFSAGGKENYIIDDNTYNDIPRIFINLFNNIDFITEIISNTPSTELSEFWNLQTNENTKILDWIRLISDNSKSISAIEHLDIHNLLIKLIN